MASERAGEQLDEADPSMADLIAELYELADEVDDPGEVERINETIELARDVERPGIFGRVIHGFDVADAAEAFLGALLFGIPMFVEGGTLEVGVALADTPVLLAGTVAATIAMVYGIIYIADIQDVRIVDPLLGILPRRLLGVLVIGFGTAVVVMTAWERVSWSEPTVAIAQCAVAGVPMVIGAALSDILPGS
ncbi:MAG: DUF2391 family protein [Halobacteriaceae archaeon]